MSAESDSTICEHSQDPDDLDAAQLAEIAGHNEIREYLQSISSTT